jgi:uncharacterized BrkB/YihY/UPF0761 family membrane protein
MAPVLLAKLRPEDVFQLWKFLVTNYPLAFIAAGAISLISYVGLILVPSVESYGRAWEKVAAGVLSLFVLSGMLIIGTLLGLYVFYNSNYLTNIVP